MLKILFIGDVSGKIGRETVKQILPEIKDTFEPDLVIANAENSAHGTGITDSTLTELQQAGVDWFTTGDHAFKREQSGETYAHLPVLRPANFPPGLPGDGYKIIDVSGHKVLLINLIGRVYMRMDYDCPFRKLDEILNDKALALNNFSAIIIDIHAEATSEKAALFHYANGRVSAILGTHTHVMTADARISNEGTAFITDTGMAGFADGSIGIEKEGVIKTFLTQVKQKHIIPEAGNAIFNAVLITIDHNDKKAVKIEPIIKHIKIRNK